MEILSIVFFLLLGGLIGGTIMLLIVRPDKPVGTLRIDSSDPDGEYMFLELYTHVDNVKNRKQVVLDVNIENYISQD